MGHFDRFDWQATSGRRLSVELLLLLTLLVVYTYFIQPPGANSLSRYDLVLALAEQGTAKIDDYHYNTSDKGYFEGHYYSDKPIGVAFLSLPVYLAWRELLEAHGHWPLNDQYVVYLLNAFVVALPTALLAVLLYRVVLCLGGTPPAAVLAAFAYGLGTMALPFATLYFGHQTSAFFGFAAFYVLLRADPRRPGPAPLGAGLLVGLAVITEYPLAIVAGLLAPYLLIRFRAWRPLWHYALGTLPPGLTLAAYNYLNFGNPFSISYSHVYLQEFAGMHEGLFGITMPNGWVLLDLLFAGKGLLTNSPVLAVAPLGALWLLWHGRHRLEGVLIALVVAAFLVYNSAYFLPFGGWAPGPRFLTPALPFAMVAVGVAASRWASAYVLTVALAVVSSAIMFVATATAPLVGEHPQIPLLERWLPAVLNGHLAFNLGMLRFGLLGLASLLPLLALLALLLLAARGARGRRVPALRMGTAYGLPLAVMLALQWPAALPGLSLGSALDVPVEDPVVLVQSVRALPSPNGDHRWMAEVTVESRYGMAPNVGLFLAVEESNGGVHHNDWIWPINLAPAEPARFVLAWEDEGGGSRRVSWIRVRVDHWSLAYPLAEVRTPLFWAGETYPGGQAGVFPRSR